MIARSTAIKLETYVSFRLQRSVWMVWIWYFGWCLAVARKTDDWHSFKTLKKVCSSFLQWMFRVWFHTLVRQFWITIMQHFSVMYFKNLNLSQPSFLFNPGYGPARYWSNWLISLKKTCILIWVNMNNRWRTSQLAWSSVDRYMYCSSRHEPCSNRLMPNQNHVT